jgi:hypothetical protein
MKKLVISIFLGICLTACPFDRTSTIGVLNNSNHTIYVYDSYLDSLSFYITDVFGETIRTGLDTTYTFDSGVSVYLSNRIEAEAITYISFPGTHRDIFTRKICTDGKLRLFIISENIVRQYGWEEICSKQLYEKKITLTEEELQQNNWVVVYE